MPNVEIENLHSCSMGLKHTWIIICSLPIFNSCIFSIFYIILYRRRYIPSYFLGIVHFPNQENQEFGGKSKGKYKYYFNSSSRMREANIFQFLPHRRGLSHRAISTINWNHLLCLIKLSMFDVGLTWYICFPFSEESSLYLIKYEWYYQAPYKRGLDIGFSHTNRLSNPFFFLWFLSCCFVLPFLLLSTSLFLNWHGQAYYRLWISF